MSELTVRRLIVWGVSFVLGFIVSVVIIGVGFPILLPSAHGVSIQEYGYIYFLVTMIPIALVFVVWLDALMGTKILPD
jgi:type IV secretory pathway TrbL component